MRVAWRRGVVSRSAVVWSLFTYQHMKLHLPSRLRKALLACLAALAAALPSTLGSATMSFWALAALAMQEKAVAADFTASKTEKDGQEYSGRIVTWDVNRSVTNNGYYFFRDNGDPVCNLSLWSAGTDDASATWFAASSSQTFESAEGATARSVYAYFWSANGGDRGQTLRFIDSGTDGGRKDLRIYLSSKKYSFTLGGLIVEAGSTDYVLGIPEMWKGRTVESPSNFRQGRDTQLSRHRFNPISPSRGQQLICSAMLTCALRREKPWISAQDWL